MSEHSRIVTQVARSHKARRPVAKAVRRAFKAFREKAGSPFVNRMTGEALRVVRVCHHVMQTHKSEEELVESRLSSFVAYAGALVVTVVVLRSLYLMYMKPDGY